MEDYLGYNCTICNFLSMGLKMDMLSAALWQSFGKLLENLSPFTLMGSPSPKSTPSATSGFPFEDKSPFPVTSPPSDAYPSVKSSPHSNTARSPRPHKSQNDLLIDPHDPAIIDIQPLRPTKEPSTTTTSSTVTSPSAELMLIYEGRVTKVTVKEGDMFKLGTDFQQLERLQHLYTDNGNSAMSESLTFNIKYD